MWRKILLATSHEPLATEMVFVLDNYDSFTYNLVQYIGECGHECVVKRNDQTTAAEVASLRPSHVLVSPGPCTPQEAGISIDLIQHFAGKVPVLGLVLKLPSGPCKDTVLDLVQLEDWVKAYVA